jgi:hypothetical protein
VIERLEKKQREGNIKNARFCLKIISQIQEVENLLQSPDILPPFQNICCFDFFNTFFCYAPRYMYLCQDT